MSFEYIKSYYGVPAELGRDVEVSGCKGTITKDLGNYIGVVFHDDPKRHVSPVHPTSEVVYLESFTELSSLKATRSKQRYQDYLGADWFTGTFGDWLRRATV